MRTLGLSKHFGDVVAVDAVDLDVRLPRVNLGAASITVTEQRLVDQRIQSEVMGVLSRHPGLTGRIAVETADQVVTLSGHLMTESQIRTAGREAGRVNGVRHVVNEIRPKVGGITS